MEEEVWKSSFRIVVTDVIFPPMCTSTLAHRFSSGLFIPQRCDLLRNSRLVETFEHAMGWKTFVRFRNACTNRARNGWMLQRTRAWGNAETYNCWCFWTDGWRERWEKFPRIIYGGKKHLMFYSGGMSENGEFDECKETWAWREGGFLKAVFIIWHRICVSISSLMQLYLLSIWWNVFDEMFLSFRIVFNRKTCLSCIPSYKLSAQPVLSSVARAIIPPSR